MIIDIHCHLDHPHYKKDLSNIIQVSKEKGIIIVTNGVDFETNKFSLDLAKKNSNILAALGLYPEDALDREKYFEGEKINQKRDLKEYLNLMKEKEKEFIAFGEVGLDLYNGKDIEKQKKILKEIINLAIKQNKPLIIHSRKAEEELLNFLENIKLNPDKIVLHCFSGKKVLIKKAIMRGYNFSIPTNIVRSEIFKYIAKEVPLEKIFTETDGPYLSPYKNNDGSININKPENILETIKEISKIKNISEKEIEKQIENNFIRVFNKKV